MEAPFTTFDFFDDEAVVPAPDIGLRLEDFVAYMPSHSYIFVPSREMWPAASVNARLPPVPIVKNGKETLIQASAWLDQHRPVDQMTWAPGEPLEIKGSLISEGGWIERRGCTVFNLYRPPTITPKPGPVDFWLEHAHRLFGKDADHAMKWLAHRVQRPHEKINHAIVLGGEQGIGKDTLLEPVKHAVGPWNFLEVSPQNMLGRFNGFLKSVILRVSEARDLGDVDRYAFYDHMKAYTAAPPDVLRVDEKHRQEYSVLNVCGVVITTNHKADGLYLPADDRRHFVAWSDLTASDFEESYWTRMYAWLENGGAAAVAAYLLGLDLSGFSPKAPPPKTDAFWEIVNASRAPEDAEMADALENLQCPAAVTLPMVIGAASEDFADWMRDRRNARRVPHRLEECGYVIIRNSGTADGRWKIGGRNHAIYAKRDLTLGDRFLAAERLCSSHRTAGSPEGP
jgi:hypothetical protein